MIESLSRIVLGPLLLAQGLYVRRFTPRLPEPQGPRAGSCGQGPSLRLLVVGDSAAAGVGVSHQDDALAGQLATCLARDFSLSWQLLASIPGNCCAGSKTAPGKASMRCWCA